MTAKSEPRRYTRPDGAAVRVDLVRGGWVYFVSWRAGQETGRAIRMPVDTFLAAIESEGMMRDE